MDTKESLIKYYGIVYYMGIVTRKYPDYDTARGEEITQYQDRRQGGDRQKRKGGVRAEKS